jgi:hypothetical protein
VGRQLTAVGITPGGVGVTESGTAAVLVAWGAAPAGALAGVVLFSVYTHLMEIPLGAIGWLAWGLSRKHQPVPTAAPGPGPSTPPQQPAPQQPAPQQPAPQQPAPPPSAAPAPGKPSATGPRHPR